MGSPLSPILAEIFMDDFESKISQHSLFKNFNFWFRYVDDIFTCFNGTSRQLDTFFNYINQINENIEYTMVKEVDNSLNFLDLTITKNIIESKECNVKFGTFLKPTQTDMVIDNKSSHPYTQKIASFYSYIHRLLSTPLSTTDYNKELKIIKQIAINNGYSTNLIDKLVIKKQFILVMKKIYPSSIDQQESKYYFSFDYIDSYSFKISKIFKKSQKNKICIAYRTNRKLGFYIKNNKTLNNNKKVDKSLRPGVYKLLCGSCNKVYIGKTSRKFKIRIYEHNYDYRYKKLKSNYAKHLLEEGHSFNDNFKVLHFCEKGSRLDTLESLEINRLKNTNTLLNDQLDINESPLLNLK